MLGNFEHLAIVLHSAHPDGVGSNGRDGGSIAGAILPLNIDGLTASEPALLVEQLSVFYPRVTGERGRGGGAGSRSRVGGGRRIFGTLCQSLVDDLQIVLHFSVIQLKTSCHPAVQTSWLELAPFLSRSISGAVDSHCKLSASRIFGGVENKLDRG